MKLLIYGNRKQDDLIIDISTPEKEHAGFLYLFNYLLKNWEVYNHEMSPTDKLLYNRALKGEGDAAKKLLERRKTHEYEQWHYGEVLDPLLV